MVVSQYGVAMVTGTGQQGRFITVTQGLLSVNVTVSKEDWDRIARMDEASRAETVLAQPQQAPPPPTQEIEGLPYASY